MPPPSTQPEPQCKSRQPDLFSFFRVASREEVEEQAAEQMVVIEAAEAKAAAEKEPLKIATAS